MKADRHRERRERAMHVRAGLERARDEHLPVRVQRVLRGAPSVDGFVEGVGRRWVALAVLDDRLDLGGRTFLRLKDVRAMTLDPDPESFQVKALRVKGEWPPVPLLADLDSFASVLGLVADAPVVGVSTSESGRYYIGSVVSADRHHLNLRTISHRGEWHRRIRTIRSDQVMRLNAGLPSDEAIRLAADSWSSASVQAEVGLASSQSGSAGRQGGDGQLESSLRWAFDSRAMVAITRRIPHVGRVEGFVVGVGRVWVAIAKVNRDVWLDGIALVRLADVTRVQPMGGKYGSWVVRALRERSQLPSAVGLLGLNDFEAPVRTYADAEGTITVFREWYDPEACWIGAVRAVDAKSLSVVEVGLRALWEPCPHLFDSESITRLDMGGGYEAVLLQAAGPPPIIQNPARS